MSLLSVKDVAAMCDLSASQIRRLVCKGVINAHKIGSYYAIDERSALAFKRCRTERKQKDIE